MTVKLSIKEIRLLIKVIQHLFGEINDEFSYDESVRLEYLEGKFKILLEK